MKTFKWWQAIFTICAILSVCPACNNDEPSMDNEIGANDNVPDPAGTIQLAMRDQDNGGTSLNYISINNENFSGWNTSFTSLGAVRGLGNVAYIPASGWASEVAVVPGEGYVAYDSAKDQFYRIYVLDYIVSTTGGIIGADVKYQTPFKGKDEAISLTTNSLSFSEYGGIQELIFNNSSIIPFKIEVNMPNCTVSKVSTQDQSFLPNGISIDLYNYNESPESIKGSITLTTLYGKKTTIDIIQAGQGPYIGTSMELIDVSFEEQVKYIDITSNIPFEDLTIDCPDEWCKAELINNTPLLQAQSRKVKFIGDKEVSPTRSSESINSASSYQLKLSIDKNEGSQTRNTEVTIKAKDKTLSQSLQIIQEGFVPIFEIRTNKIGFDKNAGSRTITINTNINDWEAQSSADWCSFNKVGNQINIRVTSTTEERTATISFPGFDTKITVLQSKYAVGDTFNENGIEGTVGYIGDEARLIYKQVSDNKGVAWSTEKVITEANSRTDGEYNMSMIKKIPFWQDFYPAFLLCEQLNTNGVTGWYLPAVEELTLCGFNYNSNWSSTEYDESYALSGNEYKYSKQTSKTIYAFHKF